MPSETRPRVVLEGGRHDGQTRTLGWVTDTLALPDPLGEVCGWHYYERTDETRHGHVVYVWDGKPPRA